MDTHTTSEARLRGEIRAEMARQGLSRTEMAARMDLTLSALSRRLNGRTPITYPESERFACALGLDFADLVRRTTEAGAA